MLNIIYSGIKLDDVSKNKILTFFEPKYPNIYADHLTLAFKSNLLPVNFGEQSELKILRYVYNDYCQAIECQILNKKIKCNNLHPHITISTADGVPPNYSNKLLSLPENQCTSVNVFNQDIILTGKIGVFTKKIGWLFKV